MNAENLHKFFSYVINNQYGFSELFGAFKYI